MDFLIPAMAPGEEQILQLDVKEKTIVNFFKLIDPNLEQMETYLGSRLHGRTLAEPPPFYLELRDQQEKVFFFTQDLRENTCHHPWGSIFGYEYLLEEHVKLIVRLPGSSLQKTTPHKLFLGWSEQVHFFTQRQGNRK